MPDHNQPGLIATMAGRTGEPPSTAMRLARAIAILVPIAGAMPTAYNVVQGYVHGISPWEVSHKLAQAKLWEKNAGCQLAYRTLNTSGGTRVDVAACSRTGDIQLKISPAESQLAAYEWIEFSRLPKTAKSASLMDIFISSAHAQGKLTPPAAAGPGLVQPAQQTAPAGAQVTCEVMQPGAKIVRIVRDGPKCYRDTIAIIKGVTEKREEVPCNTQCPAPAK